LIAPIGAHGLRACFSTSSFQTASAAFSFPLQLSARPRWYRASAARAFFPSSDFRNCSFAFPIAPEARSTRPRSTAPSGVSIFSRCFSASPARLMRRARMALW
jgi:hypothetical protein